MPPYPLPLFENEAQASYIMRWFALSDPRDAFNLLRQNENRCMWRGRKSYDPHQFRGWFKK